MGIKIRFTGMCEDGHTDHGRRTVWRETRDNLPRGALYEYGAARWNGPELLLHVAKSVMSCRV
jgi:hypothetical protein